jgi:hypothetical protein
LLPCCIPGFLPLSSSACSCPFDSSRRLALFKFESANMIAVRPVADFRFDFRVTISSLQCPCWRPCPLAFRGVKYDSEPFLHLDLSLTVSKPYRNFGVRLVPLVISLMSFAVVWNHSRNGTRLWGNLCTSNQKTVLLALQLPIVSRGHSQQLMDCRRPIIHTTFWRGWQAIDISPRQNCTLGNDPTV